MSPINFRFEVRQQLGLARTTRIMWNGHTYMTPALIYPYTPALDVKCDSFFRKSDNLVGSWICDDIIHNEKSLPFTTNDFESFLFIESKDMWGIPSFLLQQEESLSENPHIGTAETKEDLLLNLIPILCENYPEHTNTRYKEYELAAFQERLALYESAVFFHHSSGKFILEVKFSTDMRKWQYLIDWIPRNLPHLLGLKINDLFGNLSSFREILSILFTIRHNVPSNFLWIVGGVIFPQDYAMAVYLGFDFIDLRYTILAGMRGLYITPESRFWLRELHAPLCWCDACEYLRQEMKKAPITGKESPHLHPSLVQHNIVISITEMAKIHQELYMRTFRTSLEAQIHVSPYLTSLLRVLDHEYESEITRRYPLLSNHSVICIGSESYTRPEVITFLQRITTHITPAKPYAAVIIFPCAAKKPYSDSKSHQLFQRTLRRNLSPDLYEQIHQIIITSPLGVIPRELERIFPAAHYDIPVTGQWDAQEISNTGLALANWLEKYINLQRAKMVPLKIIAHIHGGYEKAYRCAEKLLHERYPIEFPFVFYNSLQDSSDSPTSDTGLSRLALLLSQLFPKSSTSSVSSPPISWQSKLTDDEICIRATLDYQFRSGVGDHILDHGILVVKSRSFSFHEIYTFDGTGKSLFGRYYLDSGGIRLTPGGAKLLHSLALHQLKIHGNSLPGTTIFYPLLKSIDRDLHPDDELLIVSDSGQYLGIGELTLASDDIRTVCTGKIGIVRGKITQQKDGETDD